MTASAPTHASKRDLAGGHDQGAVLRGLGLLTLAMMVLPAQDAIAKYLSPSMSTGQITWARFFLQTLLTLPFLFHFYGLGGLVPNRLWPNLARGALIATSSTLFFTALKFMPMADALAIFFIEPFILVVLAAIFDREPVDWPRRVAVATGFVGVLVVVRPSYEVFGLVSLIPALAGCCFAVYALLTRRLSSHDTPLNMQFTAGLSALALTSLALAIGAATGIADLSPSAVSGREALWLLLMGVFGTGGHLLFVKASRLAPSSLAAPMQYVEIATAALIGYAVFGDFPDFWSWVGIVIIVASGAYVLLNESRARTANPPLSA